MRIVTRPARSEDIPGVLALLLADAAWRVAQDPAVWLLPDGPAAQLADTLKAAIDPPDPARRAFWLVAEADDRIVGVAHAIILQIPPIYAGALGIPGLILDDTTVASDAPEGAAGRLLEAAEAKLRDAGAEMFVGSAIQDAPIRRALEARGYAATTLYLGKAGFRDEAASGGVRRATVEDVPGIVSASARHRRMLMELNRFWTTHPEADLRYGAWMQRSLTLTDREMFVAEATGTVEGYAIAQPIARPLVPLAHGVASLGILDDFYGPSFADREVPVVDGVAVALLAAAEGSFARRGFRAALVICPAAWTAERQVLEAAGYRLAKTWLIRA